MPGDQSAADAAADSEFESSGHPGDGETTDVQTRHPYTNDALAGILVVSLPLTVALAGAGVIDLTRVPVEVRLSFLAAGGVATVWAFGVAAVKAWAKARSG